MTTATKPDKAINLEPNHKITVTIDGLTIYSREFMAYHTNNISFQWDAKQGRYICKYERVLDPKDPLINNLISIDHLNKEFNEHLAFIKNSKMSKNEALSLIFDITKYISRLNFYYCFEFHEYNLHFLEVDAINNLYMETNAYMELEPIPLDDLKIIFLLRHYKAKLEDLTKAIINEYNLIKFFKSGKTETHKQLFIGQKYICTVPSDKQKEAKELVTGFLIKGVNTELLKDYLKVNLAIL